MGLGFRIPRVQGLMLGVLGTLGETSTTSHLNRLVGANLLLQP